MCVGEGLAPPGIKTQALQSPHLPFPDKTHKFSFRRDQNRPVTPFKTYIVCRSQR